MFTDGMKNGRVGVCVWGEGGVTVEERHKFLVWLLKAVDCTVHSSDLFDCKQSGMFTLSTTNN